MVQGPVGPELLQHVCALYGANVDSRYADLEFTRKVFNENPAGYSHHGLLVVGEAVVGCYSIIPYIFSGHNGSIAAGKGEALYVRQEYRPWGIPLVRQTLDYVERRGLDFVFGLSNDRIGKLLKLFGFRALTYQRRHRIRLLRPGALRRLACDKLRLACACSIAAAQALWGCAAGTACRVSEVTAEVNGPDHVDRVLQQLSHRWRPAKGSQWAVATDISSLRWLVMLGVLEVLTFDGDSDEFVVIVRAARGRNFEVAHWQLRHGGLKRAIAVLQLVTALALRDGAATVSVTTDVSSAGKYLIAAASLLGFIPRKSELIVHTKCTDPTRADAVMLDYTSFMSI